LKLPITSIHLSVIQACLWQRKGLNLFSLTFTKYAINLSQALIKVSGSEARHTLPSGKTIISFGTRGLATVGLLSRIWRIFTEKT
jgi:hypothetical protein